MVLRRNIQLNVVGVSFVMQWLSCLIIVLLYTDLIQQ
jgi:Na+-transporting methylmalonyl-CoA/oxaloacetate decarboxylase gamma subunit